jgi:predicted phosphodiesterase
MPEIVSFPEGRPAVTARLLTTRSWLRGGHRWWVLGLLAAALALVGAWMSFLVTPPATVTVGVVSAQIRAVPGSGTVVRSAEGRAVTDDAIMRGPLQVQVDVAFRPAVDTNEPKVLAAISDARPKLVHGVETYLLRVAGGAVVVAVVLAALLLGLGWPRLLATGLASIAIVASGAGITAGTMQPSAFDAASCAHGWSRYALADLPELTPPAPTVVPPPDATAAANDGLVGVVLIADDHLNPEGLRFAAALQHTTGAQAVLDAGDTTSYGVPGEACVVAPLIRSFRVPYVWVRGNHDSAAFQRTMKAIRGVRVLDGSATTVAGITVWGVGDPSFTPRRLTSTAQMAANAARTRVGLAATVEEADLLPDVVLTHECQMAASADPVNPGVVGVVPLVACGHTHREAETERSGTTILHTGTVGAGGLGAFDRGELQDFDAMLLYFDATTHRLVKYYTVSGAGGSAALFSEHDISVDVPLLLHRNADSRLRP